MQLELRLKPHCKWSDWSWMLNICMRTISKILLITGLMVMHM